MKEIDDIMQEMNDDIDRVLNSTTRNTNTLVKKNRVSFSAELKCDYCGKSHKYN